MMSSKTVTKHRKKTNSQELVFFQRCLPSRASDVDFVSDVHCVSDVSPYGEVGKHHITLRPSGAIHYYGEAITSLRQRRNITPKAPPQFPAKALQSPRLYAILITERRWE